MRILLALIITAFSALTLSAQAISDSPMYGGFDSPEFRAVNEKFVNSMVAQYGSRQAAAKEALKWANGYVAKAELEMAMKRFNQAWLLDPENADVFAGFAMISTFIGNYDEADGFYERAEELAPADGSTYADHALMFLFRANNARSKDFFDLDYIYKDKHDPEWRARVTPLLDRSIELAAKAADLMPNDAASYIVWASALYAKGKYAAASQKLETAQKLGGKQIPEKLLRSLNKNLKRDPAQ